MALDETDLMKPYVDDRTVRPDARPGAGVSFARLGDELRPLFGDPELGHGAHALEVLVEQALVLGAQEDQRRLVGQRTPRVGVHVPEEEPREVAPVPESALGRELDGLHHRAAVPVDAEVAPRGAARDVEVGREVETALHARRKEAVELVHVLRDRDESPVLVARERPVVVVDADGVVAEPEDALGEPFRLLGRFREAGGLAEVHAVEALRHAGQSLELDVVADGAQEALFPGGGVVRDDAREVERRAGQDRLAVIHPHPAAAFRHDDRTGVGDGEAAGGIAIAVKCGFAA